MAWQDDTALIIVDVQDDFWFGTVENNNPNFEKNFSALLARFRNENALIIHVRAVYNEKLCKWMPFWETLKTKGGIGTKDVFEKPCDFAKEREGEEVVIKHTFDAFNNTTLDSILIKHGIKRLVFTGMVTSCCVLFSVATAFLKGYQTIVVSDCVADRFDERHCNTLKIYGSYMFALAGNDHSSSELKQAPILSPAEVTETVVQLCSSLQEHPNKLPW